MRMKRAIATALGALLAAPGLLLAQATPTTGKPPAISVILSYHEDNSGTFRIMSEKATEVSGIQDGDELKTGWTVVTGAGDVAELKLNHTGTIIKVSENTNFTIESLRTETSGQDVFSLGVGKVRTVAGRASGKDKYQIRTQSAVCGVRGSDIIVEFAEARTSRLYTLEGTGWIQDVASGKELDVPKGDFADALAASFQVVQIPQNVLSGLQQEMAFTRLDPGAANALEKAYQQELPNPQKLQSQQPSQNQAAPPAPATSGFVDNVFTALHDILGMEVGSVTIGGQTYGEAILEPTFTAGQLKLALYLPIIYQDNMLDPGDWYRPAGNNEWSFGTDQPNSSAAAADLIHDLLLKFKYIEYGRQEDPFFLKVGDLEDITIGHGLLMRDFANDAEFPAVRRVGANIGIDTPGGGFEAMVNDVTPDIANGAVYPPDVVAGRIYVRPIPGFRGALGFSAIVDLNPARDFFDPAYPGLSGPDAAGNPIFIDPGVDFDLPFVQTDSLGLVFFADAAISIPYFRSTPTDPSFTSISPGFDWNAVYEPSSSLPVRNWGAGSGFFGNLITADLTWRLEYRYFTGTFQPQLFDTAYEQNRSAYLLSVLQYLTDPTNTMYNNIKMGIYGEGGFKLSRVFSLRLGYFWPWTVNESTGAWGPDPNNPDHFVASFEIEKGAIPVANLWGSVSYERSNLFSGSGLPASLQDAVFNANTTMSAQINYSASPIVDLSLLYTVTPVLVNGQLQYANGSTLPDMTSSVSITTSIHL